MVGVRLVPEEGLRHIGLGNVDGSGGTPCTPMVCQPEFPFARSRAAAYTTLFPPKDAVKLRFSTSVNVLPVPAAEEPENVTVHWLLAIVPMPSMALPVSLVPSPLSGTM